MKIDSVTFRALSETGADPRGSLFLGDPQGRFPRPREGSRVSARSRGIPGIIPEWRIGRSPQANTARSTSVNLLLFVARSPRMEREIVDRPEETSLHDTPDLVISRHTDEFSICYSLLQDTPPCLREFRWCTNRGSFCFAVVCCRLLGQGLEDAAMLGASRRLCRVNTRSFTDHCWWPFVTDSGETSITRDVISLPLPRIFNLVFNLLCSVVFIKQKVVPLCGFHPL